MVNKGQIKLIRSLHEKKYRIETGLFLVEGEKSVLELLKSDFEIDRLYCTKNFAEKHKEKLSDVKFEILSQDELEKISYFETNDSVLAIVKQKNNQENQTKEGRTIILDDIRDPGNLGTIIRICDWYGIKEIVASENTVDFYNPKVISASMGSFTRVNLFYTNLIDYLTRQAKPIYGAFLDGEDIHKIKIPDNAIVVMGSESKGISKDIEKIIKNKITIPSYGKAESLNVAVATAITLDNWIVG